MNPFPVYDKHFPPPCLAGFCKERIQPALCFGRGKPVEIQGTVYRQLFGAYRMLFRFIIFVPGFGFDIF